MAKTMEEILKIPAGPERMKALAAMKAAEAKKKKDTRTTKDIAPEVKQVKPKDVPAADAGKTAKEGETRAQKQRRLIEEETGIKGSKF